MDIDTLKTNGYISFNLKDFDNELYTQLEEASDIPDTSTWQETCTTLRIDFKSTDSYETTFSDLPLPSQDQCDINSTKNIEDNSYHHQCKFTFNNFAEANEFKTLFLNKSDSYDIAQIWFYATDILSSLDQVYEKLIDKILSEFYNITDTDPIGMNTTFTYYNKECSLESHRDGPDASRICAILLYLNKNYDENDGGYLVLDGNVKVYPTFGTTVILDFTQNDIEHEVIKCTNNGRHALLTFLTLN